MSAYGNSRRVSHASKAFGLTALTLQVAADDVIE
jgi:hypothetical protein